MQKPSNAEDKREQHTEETKASGELQLKDILERFDTAKKYVDSGFRPLWDNCYRVYKGKRVIRNYNGISDPSVREAHTIIETLVANLAGGLPKFHFTKTNEEQTDDTDVLNNMLDYYMVINRMGLKNQEWVRESLLYGTGVLYVTWAKGRPVIQNIPLRDFFVDPTSTGLVETMHNARYAGFHYLANIEDLKRQKIYDAKQDKFVPKYQGLDDVGLQSDSDGKEGDNANSSMDKAFKDMFSNSTLSENAPKNQVYMILMHDLDTGRIYEVANRKKVVFSAPTWCQRDEQTVEGTTEYEGQEVTTKKKLKAIEPFLPFAVLRDYVDVSQFYGSGEMELIYRDNELVNDYESMDIDNNAYQNTPMYWVDPQYADFATEIETIPGAVYPIPRNAMGVIERPQLSGDLENKKLAVLQRMRRATAADEAVQGVAQQKGSATATEIQNQVNQANTRFATKTANMESEGYAQLGSLLFKLIQVFVTKRSTVRIVGPRGVYFHDYDPYEFDGEWEAHVELDSTLKQKEIEVGMRDEKNKELMLGNPIFDQIELSRYFLQKNDPDLTDEKFNAMLAPPAEPQEKDPYEHITLNYKDASPWTKYQIEQALELQPDPSHLKEMEVNGILQAKRSVDGLDPTLHADGSPVEGLANQSTSMPPSQGQPAGNEESSLEQPSGDDLVGMSEKNMASLAQAQAAAEDGISPMVNDHPGEIPEGKQPYPTKQ